MFEDAIPLNNKESCGFCGIKPNQSICISGSWGALFYGAEEDGAVYMVAIGGNGDESDHYYPKFCPECGRKIR